MSRTVMLLMVASEVSTGGVCIILGRKGEKPISMGLVQFMHDYSLVSFLNFFFFV